MSPPAEAPPPMRKHTHTADLWLMEEHPSLPVSPPQALLPQCLFITSTITSNLLLFMTDDFNYLCLSAVKWRERHRCDFGYCWAVKSERAQGPTVVFWCALNEKRWQKKKLLNMWEWCSVKTGGDEEKVHFLNQTVNSSWRNGCFGIISHPLSYTTLILPAASNIWKNLMLNEKILI